MEIKFAQSARKHRIGKAHVHHVIDHYVSTRVEAEASGVQQLVWVGFDDRGLELEVVRVDLIDYVLVIHVMPTNFRRRY